MEKCAICFLCLNMFVPLCKEEGMICADQNTALNQYILSFD